MSVAPIDGVPACPLMQHHECGRRGACAWEMFGGGSRIRDQSIGDRVLVRSLTGGGNQPRASDDIELNDDTLGDKEEWKR